MFQNKTENLPSNFISKQNKEKIKGKQIEN